MIKAIPSITTSYAATGKSKKTNELGMRPMQERAYEKRGEQYLLIKSPPASGKSRALMFIALDKVMNQGLKQALIVVPEKSIGSSFRNTELMRYGFWADWEVNPRWDLCKDDVVLKDENAEEKWAKGKVKNVGEFLQSGDKFLVCTHSTFRFAMDEYGVEAFDGRLIAIDEFHHVSANPNNRLGTHLKALLERGKTHIIAMTGSYFRGDSDAVLMPEDEAKFETVTYTYYEQLNGYEYLKTLDIGYYFYNGSYLDSIMDVLDPHERTIVHIPSVNSRESSKDKYKEVEQIINALGRWDGTDPETGFQLVTLPSGEQIRIADLVDDDETKRSKVIGALKDSAQANNRDHVNIIIALGMAKEGFDWIWCEHALTVGYRNSLTEIVQIIGRCTRDAPGKTRAHFTNLIAEPDATQDNVAEAVNDTLKAISASLLMEQVLAPKFEFRPKVSVGNGTGENGGETDSNQGSKSGGSPGTLNLPGQESFTIEIKGLRAPKSKEAQRICRNDVSEIIADFLQDNRIVERGTFDPDIMPAELTVAAMGRVVRERYPHINEGDREAIREHAVCALNALKAIRQQYGKDVTAKDVDIDVQTQANTAFVDSTRRFLLDVRELNIDLIESINPFEEAYSILSKSMDEERLRRISDQVRAKRTKITPEDAEMYARRAVAFIKAHGRKPDMNSQDSWEALIAEGAAAFMRYRKEGVYDKEDAK